MLGDAEEIERLALDSGGGPVAGRVNPMAQDVNGSADAVIQKDFLNKGAGHINEVVGVHVVDKRSGRELSS